MDDVQLTPSEAKNSPLAAASRNLKARLQVTSTEDMVISSMLEHFSFKPIMLHQAQAFDQYPLVNAYDREKDAFLKTARAVCIRDIRKGSNVISSHTLYRIKHTGDRSLKQKARIAPHGNEDASKHTLSKHCATCPPAGLRVLEYVASLLHWTLYKADVRAASLQTGDAKKDMYVKPPGEIRMRTTVVWVLLTAVYGLANANEKMAVQVR